MLLHKPAVGTTSFMKTSKMQVVQLRSSVNLCVGGTLGSNQTRPALQGELRGSLHVYDFPYESAYDLMQIGWGSDSPYDKNIWRLHTIRIVVRIPVRFPVRIRIRFRAF
jgi:hypothetical protein